MERVTSKNKFEYEVPLLFVLFWIWLFIIFDLLQQQK
jgi:hypothetical protein